MADEETTVAQEELRQLHRSPHRFWFPVLLTWGAIATVFAGLAFASASLEGAALAASWLGSFLAIGWLQYVLVQAMHEAVHQKFRIRGAQSALAALATTWPVGLTRAYRDVHMAHHKYPGDPERDPDWILYGRWPRSRFDFVLRVALYFSGLQAVVQRLGQTSRLERVGPEGSGAQSFGRWEIGVVALLQLVLLATFTVVFGLPFYFYFLFWLFPILTVVKGLGYLRILAEHGDPVEPMAYRSFAASWLRTRFLGPFGFTYHAEHHAHPAIP
jgi:fatty acid desaturase